MRGKIKHSGVVESVNGSSLKVRIVQTSACASCHAASACHAEKRDMLVDVYDVEPGRYAAGDEVTVMASDGMGAIAVVVAFCIPSVLMLTVILAVVKISGNELAGVLGGMGVLAPYYFVVWLMRDRLSRKLVFSLS